MSGYLPIQFIEDKVRDLQNALFFSMSDAVLKIPTCVVKLLETDELGQLWFIIPRPSQYIHAFDRTFPVKLDFFRKGRDYYIKIFGKAFLVNDPEEINGLEGMDESIKEQTRSGQALLMRVQISSAEYSEKSSDKAFAKGLVNQMKSKLFQWFQMSRPGSQLRIPVHINYPSVSAFSN